MCYCLPETSIWVGGAGATSAGDVPQVQPVGGSQRPVYCQRRHGGSCASHHWGWRPAQPVSSQCKSLLITDTLPHLLVDLAFVGFSGWILPRLPVLRQTKGRAFPQWQTRNSRRASLRSERLLWPGSTNGFASPTVTTLSPPQVHVGG